MNKINYCRECGSVLNKTKVKADTIKIKFGAVFTRLSYPFDQETGEQNFAIVLKCPNKQTSPEPHDYIARFKNKDYYLE